jgi:hypothetical protein
MTWRAPWLHLAIIVVATCLAYAGSLGGAFVSDDTVSVVANETIRGLDAAHLARIFTTFDDANYIPIKVLTIAVDHRLWGLDPVGYHVTNLAIHVGCALLVYVLLGRLGLAPPAALAAALVWSLHPLQVESVAWISERKNVLSGFFFFAALLTYLGFRERRGAGVYVALLVLFALALLSKMNTVVLPAVILAYERTWHHGLRRREVVAMLPLVVLGALVVWYNLAGNPLHGARWHGGNAIVTWLSSIVVIFRYLAAVVLPTGLAPKYQVPLYGSALALPVLASIVGVLALAGVTMWLVARRRREAFWLAWFALCLAPMLNIVPFPALMQDRFMYLPLLGPVALVAGWADAAARAAAARRALAVAAAALIAVYGALTIRQVEVWDNPLALWRAEAVTAAFYAYDPGARLPDFDAKRDFVAAVAAEHPSSGIAVNNHAGLLYAAGQRDAALAGFERAAQLAPRDATVLVNLARAYAAAGRLDEAEVMAARAAAAAPYWVHVQRILAQVRIARGDAAGARAALAACTRILGPEVAARALEHERAAIAALERAG